MLRMVVVDLAFAAAMLGMSGAPQQTTPSVPAASASGAVSYPCDADGEIRCMFDQVETVTGSRSLEDMRIIGKYIQLISERNRRYYNAWQTKSPSAAYELVKRVKPFPYLPYGDTYSIVGLDIVLNQPGDQLIVRYPKKPKQNSTRAVPDADMASYATKLSDFIKSLQKEIEKLKKYEKAPGFPF